MTFTTSETSGQKILLIDDDTTVLSLIKFILDQAGYETYTAVDGPTGVHQLHVCQPNLVILDVMLPEVNGWQICRQIRQCSDVPVLMLTALAGAANIIHGLEMGADDYLEKPFDAGVLLARVRALLRRTTLPAISPAPIIYEDGYLTIDLQARQVLVREQPIRLSPTEYKLLACLVQQANQVLSSTTILQTVWGWADHKHLHLVHLTIGRLRRKLQDDPQTPRYVITEHGLGYRFKTRLLR